MQLPFFTSGDKKWYDKDKKLHKEDGPAYIFADGSKSWYMHGKLHRENGPACEFVTGNIWFLGGKKIDKNLHAQLTGDIKNLPLYLGLGWDEYIAEKLNPPKKATQE